MSKSLQHSEAANISWAKTVDRTARTEPGRRGHWQKLLAEYGGDEKRARNAYKAHFQMMARKSRKVRAARKAGGE